MHLRPANMRIQHTHWRPPRNCCNSDRIRTPLCCSFFRLASWLYLLQELCPCGPSTISIAWRLSLGLGHKRYSAVLYENFETLGQTKLQTMIACGNMWQLFFERNRHGPLCYPTLHDPFNEIWVLGLLKSHNEQSPMEQTPAGLLCDSYSYQHLPAKENRSIQSFGPPKWPLFRDKMGLALLHLCIFADKW